MRSVIEFKAENTTYHLMRNGLTAIKGGEFTGASAPVEDPFPVLFEWLDGREEADAKVPPGTLPAGGLEELALEIRENLAGIVKDFYSDDYILDIIRSHTEAAEPPEKVCLPDRLRGALIGFEKAVGTTVQDETGFHDNLDNCPGDVANAGRYLLEVFDADVKDAWPTYHGVRREARGEAFADLQLDDPPLDAREAKALIEASWKRQAVALDTELEAAKQAEAQEGTAEINTHILLRFRKLECKVEGLATDLARVNEAVLRDRLRAEELVREELPTEPEVTE